MPLSSIMIKSLLFSILDFEKRFQGQGDIVSALEWDVKSYFILGGGMHDSSI